MHYIKVDDIADSWENLNKKKLSNKFIGLIGVLKVLSNNHTNSIVSKKQYTMHGKELSQWLDSLFFFGTLPSQYPSTDIYWITFSIEWKDKIIPLILKHEFDLYDLAIVLLRKTPFLTNQITHEELYKKLFEIFPLIQELSNAYVYDTTKNKTMILLDTDLALDTDVKIKLESKFSTSSNESIGFEGNDNPWLNKRAGELTSAPFFQTLYAGQGVSECVIFNKFDFLKAYGFDTLCSIDDEIIDKVNTIQLASLEFPHKNILFKGVPGTGKSHTIDEIIETKLGMDKSSENILRINIHSASSNADLMQGIGISTNNNTIQYKEKQGLIFDRIKKACYSPNQPFVLILEEIQENSLNELIGDLIYLIEPSKRAKIQNTAVTGSFEYASLIEAYLKENPQTHYVEIPFLVSNETKYRKMILPDNLYVFCTSNYRDDKKVIEDNLLRRFDVIEVYPRYDYSEYHSKEIADFLKMLNTSILKVFELNEIHPDRFQIGHANWLNIGKEETTKEIEFYKALLKVVVEFKEIREIEYKRGIKPIFESIVFPNNNWVHNAFNMANKNNSYEKLIQFLQCKSYGDILQNCSDFSTENYDQIQPINDSDDVRDNNLVTDQQ